MGLTGYRRSDGQVGFRNHVLIMPLTGCAADIARRICDQVPGTTCFAHPNGCDLQGGDFTLMGAILAHHCTHPNVGGVLFLTMSCAAGLSLQLPKAVTDSGRLTKTINTQQSGGTSKTTDAGIAAAQEMVKQLSTIQRDETDASALVIGTKCGASDENSFKICHPVVGRACDMLVADGATVVLSEDCELVFGAEQLAARATAPEIADQIRAIAPNTNAAWKTRFGQSFDDIALEGGKSREELTARSAEHADKAGTAPISGFFEMEDIVEGPGLMILNAPNTDLENTTCLAAAGCNVTLFTTGRGTCVGSPTSITLKITATARTAETMEENIDISVASATDGTESIGSAAERVVEAILIATESMTKSEILKHHEVAIPIRGVTY